MIGECFEHLLHQAPASTTTRGTHGSDLLQMNGQRVKSNRQLAATCMGGASQANNVTAAITCAAKAEEIAGTRTRGCLGGTAWAGNPIQARTLHPRASTTMIVTDLFPH